MEVEVRDRLAGVTLGLTTEDGALSQRMWVASRTWKMGGTRLSPRASKGHGPAEPVVSVQEGPLRTSGPQNWKTINLCCFKPLSLWSFVTEMIGN